MFIKELRVNDEIQGHYQAVFSFRVKQQLVIINKKFGRKIYMSIKEIELAITSVVRLGICMSYLSAILMSFPHVFSGNLVKTRPLDTR